MNPIIHKKVQEISLKTHVLLAIARAITATIAEHDGKLEHDGKCNSKEKRNKKNE